MASFHDSSTFLRAVGPEECSWSSPISHLLIISSILTAAGLPAFDLAGLFVMFPGFERFQDALTLYFLFETAERLLERLVWPKLYFRHRIKTPFYSHSKSGQPLLVGL